MSWVKLGYVAREPKCILVSASSMELQSAHIDEFLYPFALGFGRIDVALAVDGDEMQIVELAGHIAHVAEGSDFDAIGTLNNVDLSVCVVGAEQEALLGIGPEND